MTARDDETHLLSGAYALHALTPEEAERFEAALAESEELRGEAVGLTDTAVELGLAVPSVEPPPALRASVLAAIVGLPQEPRAVAEEPPAPAPAPSVRHVAPHRRRRLRRPAVLVGLVAAAALLFGGGVLVQQTVYGPQTEYGRIAAASDARNTTVPVEGGGTATVTWSASRDATAVVLKGVRTPPGRSLQLWRIAGGRTVSEGLYQPGDDALRVFDGVPPVKGERIAVTVEPRGGSAQPTTAPIAELPLAA